MSKRDFPTETRNEIDREFATREPAGALHDLEGEGGRFIGEACCDVFAFPRSQLRKAFSELYSWGSSGYRALKPLVMRAYKGPSTPGRVSSFLDQVANRAHNEGAVHWTIYEAAGTTRNLTVTIPTDMNRKIRIRCIDEDRFLGDWCARAFADALAKPIEVSEPEPAAAPAPPEPEEPAYVDVPLTRRVTRIGGSR